MPIDFSTTAASFLTQFGEAITYVKASGATRSITAVVDRQPEAELRELSGVMRPSMQVHVANSTTTGIAATELNTATDVLRLAHILGGTVANCKIDRMVTQDAGMLVLEVH